MKRSMWRRLIPLIAILLVAWLLVLAGTVLIFGYVAPLKLADADFNPITEAVIKVVVSALLAAIWVLILYALTFWYFKWALKVSTTSTCFPCPVLGM